MRNICSTAACLEYCQGGYVLANIKLTQDRTEIDKKNNFIREKISYLQKRPRGILPHITPSRKYSAGTIYIIRIYIHRYIRRTYIDNTTYVYYTNAYCVEVILYTYGITTVFFFIECAHERVLENEST